MADLGQIMDGIPTSTHSKTEVKYKCYSDVSLLSPVKGTITKIDNDAITITSDDSNTFKIKKIKLGTPPPVENTQVGKGSPLSVLTTENVVFLTSTQDLSSLLGVKPEKDESPTKTKLKTGLGLSREDAKRIATDAVSGTIGISNAPYQLTLDALNKLPPLKKESNEIKDNVLSEELKRIKSLF